MRSNFVHPLDYDQSLGE